MSTHSQGKAWPRTVRLLCIVTAAAALCLLYVDSPLAPASWQQNHAIFEAIPLLLVGTTFLACIIIERPALIEFLKQAILGAAFVLWGIDMLLPPSPFATFIGALIIAIYVFDLIWIIQGKLRPEI
jgi:hypothetical protein